MVMSNNVNLFLTSNSPHLVSVAFDLEIIPESDSTGTCLSRATAALGVFAHRAPTGEKTGGSGPLLGTSPLSLGKRGGVGMSREGRDHGITE